MSKSIARISLIGLILLFAMFIFGLTQLHAASFAFHAYAHQTVQRPKVDGGAECSATAIGPHALLTASHCERATSHIAIDGIQADVATVLRDEEDHSIYLLTGISFNTWYAGNIPVDLPLSVGDDVVIFGNPGAFHDMLRRAYVSGSDGPGPSILFLDGNINEGDSGAGVFNATGTLLGVISVKAMGDGIKFSGMYPMKFTEAQVKQAREF